MGEQEGRRKRARRGEGGGQDGGVRERGESGLIPEEGSDGSSFCLCRSTVRLSFQILNHRGDQSQLNSSDEDAARKKDKETSRVERCGVNASKEGEEEEDGIVRSRSRRSRVR